MNCNANLTDKEECLITSVLSKGKTLKIAKMISKYYQSVKKFIVDLGQLRYRSDKGILKTILSNSPVPEEKL